MECFSPIGRAHLGYIDDVIAALEEFPEGGDGADGDRHPAWSPWGREEPAVNPFRGVGRNDPCPCGSGRKAKKCCLA